MSSKCCHAENLRIRHAVLHNIRFTVFIGLAVTTKTPRLIFEAIVNGILTVQPKIVIIILFPQWSVPILTARTRRE